MSERKRWICWPEFDLVCVEGGCGYCDPYNCACGKKHTGSRSVTAKTVETAAQRQGLQVTKSNIEDGMERRSVER